mmetsp:Transcript_31124/g.89283  ORF Transcript_31124/g.89283 Transcript_31124/m.89283 type:complete len:284 (-) Transcript_31124:92-943(-)
MVSAGIDRGGDAIEVPSGSGCRAQEHVDTRHAQRQAEKPQERMMRRQSHWLERLDITDVEGLARERLEIRMLEAAAAAERCRDPGCDLPRQPARGRNLKDTPAVVHRSRWGNSADEYTPEALDWGDMFLGNIQAAWVFDGILYVVTEGMVATTILGEPWDGQLQDGGELFQGNVQAAWTTDNLIYVVKNGKVAVAGRSHAGKLRWDGSLTDWGPLLRGNVVAAWVADGSLYVVKRRGKLMQVSICSWGDPWDGHCEYWTPVLDSSCKTAWVHEGFIYVVKADI